MSVKRATLPEGFDRDTVKRAIASEIDRMVANNTGCAETPATLATSILHHWTYAPLAPSNAFAKVEEQRKLDDLVRASRQMKAIWDDLDPEVRFALKTAADPSGPFRGRAGSTSVAPRYLMGFIQFGPEILEQPVKAIKKEIQDGAQVSSRTNYPELRIVEACADVWQRRTGKRPKSAGGKHFSLFVAGVFDVLSIDASVRNTITAWAKIYRMEA